MDQTRHKIKICAANTVRAGALPEGKLVTLDWREYRRVLSYIEELRQQAKWDEEKCNKQR